MVDGRFTWGTSTELAALWNVAPVTARNYAAEAVRLYRRLVAGFGEDLRARIMARLEFIGRDSLERTEEVVDGMGDKHTVRRPDHRTARQCVMDQAQLAGLLVHKHTMSVTEMTDEELRAQLRAHGLEVVQVAAPSNREETH
jgi:hypothetical protein